MINLKTCYNFKPDVIAMGADLPTSDTLGELKDDYPNLKGSVVFRSN